MGSGTPMPVLWRTGNNTGMRVRLPMPPRSGRSRFMEGTRNVVDAATAAGVKRYVHMSALGTRPAAVSEYHRTKYLAEQYVRASSLDWTIFRPSMIHGPGGEFMGMVKKWVAKKAPPFF